MMRGQVVPEEARAWTAGLLLASDYFAHARREAVAKASAAIRGKPPFARRTDPGRAASLSSFQAPLPVALAFEGS